MNSETKLLPEVFEAAAEKIISQECGILSCCVLEKCAKKMTGYDVLNNNPYNDLYEELYFHDRGHTGHFFWWPINDRYGRYDQEVRCFALLFAAEIARDQNEAL